MLKIDNLLYSDISNVIENPISSAIKAKSGEPFFRLKYAINHILPCRNKFMQDIHLAVLDNEIKTYAELEFVKNTAKIIFSNFMTMENSSEILAKFLDYILEKYSTLKEAIFYITLFDCDIEVINIFLNSAKFKKIASINYYDVKQELQDYTPPNYIKRYATHRADYISDLYNYSLNDVQKFYFIKKAHEIDFDYTNSPSYVMENPENEEVLSAFRVIDEGENNYTLEVIFSKSYTSFLLDAIKYVNHILAMRKKDYSLKLSINSAYIFYKDLKTQLEENKFKFLFSKSIFAKDYLNRVKNSESIEAFQLAFGDRSPAYQSSCEFKN